MVGNGAIGITQMGRLEVREARIGYQLIINSINLTITISIVFFLCAFCKVSFAAVEDLNSRKTQTNISHEEKVDFCEIVTVVLTDFTIFKIESPRLVIQSETVWSSAEAEMLFKKTSAAYWKDVGDRLPALEESTIANYINSNKQLVNIPSMSCGSIPKPVVYVSKKKLNRVFEKGGWWDEFYEKYPGSSGIIEFSRPGYSTDGRQALIYVSRTSGGLAGSGYLVLLELKDRKWVIVGEMQQWIS